MTLWERLSLHLCPTETGRSVWSGLSTIQILGVLPTVLFFITVFHLNIINKYSKITLKGTS